MNTMEEVRRDIAAFADDEGSVEICPDGALSFERSGIEQIGQIRKAMDGSLTVEIDGKTYSHRNFVAEYLAKLSTMADRIVERREHPKVYIDSPAELQSYSLNRTTGKTLDLLGKISENASPFSTRLAFVTADAGQGKTVALQEYQRNTAKAYLANNSQFLFWHVDLQGRQLVRLNEALMGDLGDLRMTGIFMPSIIRLVRHGLLILAIDGFDELAVEQGSVDALGALSALVSKLNGSGTIVAASRRTFFDTDDYIRRSKILSHADTPPCEIDQLQILPWTVAENRKFLKEVAPDGINGYGSLDDTLQVFKDAVGNADDHPLMTRPFLFTFAVRSAMSGLDKNAVLSLQSSESADAMESVKRFVDALIERDVMNKWRSKEGKPYMTHEQHNALLAEIATEMWSQQRDRIRLDALEQISLALLELWETSSPMQVMHSIKMHALLPPVYEGGDYRKFDHPEFQNYFLAVALLERAIAAVKSKSAINLSRFLSIAQLPESVGRYVCMLLREKEGSVEQLLEMLQLAVRQERRPTFLQLNVGAITPYLMYGIDPGTPTVFDAKVPYSKLSFEGTVLNNRKFKRGELVSVSFQRVKWQDVTFEDCLIAECSFDVKGEYKDVNFIGCDLQSVSLLEDGDELRREYVPERIAILLEGLGIAVENASHENEVISGAEVPETRGRVMLQKFLRLFGRTVIVFEDGIEQKFSNDARVVVRDLIPILEEYAVIRERAFTTGGTPKRKWQLERSFEEVLRSEDSAEQLDGFWEKIDAI